MRIRYLRLGDVRALFPTAGAEPLLSQLERDIADFWSQVQATGGGDEIIPNDVRVSGEVVERGRRWLWERTAWTDRTGHWLCLHAIPEGARSPLDPDARLADMAACQLTHAVYRLDRKGPADLLVGWDCDVSKLSVCATRSDVEQLAEKTLHLPLGDGWRQVRPESMGSKRGGKR